MNTAACPQCHDEVTIPPNAPRSAQVRCPWCREEFELSAVLDALPPMLEIVSTSHRFAASDDTDEGFALAGGEDFAASEPSGANAHAPAFDFAGGGGTASAAPTTARPRAAKVATSGRPKRKEKSVVAEMFKVVIGGVVGLILAQLILWWLPDKYKRDPFELGPVVSQYAPWIVPAMFHANGGAATSDSSRESNPSRTVDTSGGSQVASSSPIPANSGNTSGGHNLDEAWANNQSRQQAENQGALLGAGSSPNESTPADPLAAAPTVPENPTLGQDPLEIPEPDLSLAPGIGSPAESGSSVPLASDPFASGAAMPEAATPQPPSPVDAADQATPAETPNSTPSGTADSPAPGTTQNESVGGVRDAPTFSTEEIRAALTQAQAAESVFFNADTGAAENAQRDYYAALTRLAEKITFADPQQGELQDLQEQVHAALSQGNVRERAKMLISLGPARLSLSKDSRPDQGVVLFGRIQSVEQQGKLWETRLEMPASGGPNVIPIFASEKPSHDPGATVIILGAIVDEPSQHIPEYRGSLPSVVWSGQAVTLTR